jgi:copper homeostasis protein
MIRPRGGDFCYSTDEFAVMEYDLEMAKANGADMIVLGLLQADGTIDAARSAKLIARARPLPVTFHRAFDMTREPWEAFNTLLELGVERLLTSGQEVTPVEGIELITELIERAGEKMIVMPGGGVNERNIRKLLRVTKAREIHSSAAGLRDSRMSFRNPRVFMGGQLGPPEFALKVAREDRVRSFRDLIG